MPLRNCSRVYAVALENAGSCTSCSSIPWKYGCRIGECLALGDAWLEAREHVDPAAATVVHVVPVGCDLRLERDRHEQTRRRSDIEAGKSALRDADHGQRIVVGGDGLADDRRIRAVAVAPVVVAEHRHIAHATDFVIVGGNDAPHRGAHTEHAEVGARDQFARHPLGRAIHAQCDRHWTSCEHTGEDLRRRRWIGNRQADAWERGVVAAIDEVVAEVLVHREREHVAAGVVAVVIARALEQHQLLGVLDRQAAQQYFVNQREDSGVGADAERDRQQSNRGEQGRAGEAANGVAKIPD